MNLLDLPEIDPKEYYLYSVSSRAYFDRALKNFNSATEEKHRLFYAALECRYAIEMLLKEYLLALSGLGGTRSMRKKYKPSTLKRDIERREPYLYDKMRFISALIKAEKDDLSYPILDLNKIEQYYEDLNKYLHTDYLPKHLIEAVWWKDFKKEIDTILDGLWPPLNAPRIQIVCNAEGLKLFHRFRKNELSENDILEIARTNAWGAAEVEIHFRQFPQE